LEVIEIVGQADHLQVELANVGPQDEQFLRQVIVLGDMSRRTLGFLPQVAFMQAADSGTLLAAVHDGRVLGYALYSLPRQVIRLTHLCVSESARGRGVARRLVDAISERHADRFGITLKCRKDYPANELWPLLGFVSQGEVRGRSRQRLPLTVWWRDHGHPNLFSAAESIGLLRVAVDVNVFLDLESRSERHGVIGSRALAGDWLADQLELVVTGELLRELARMPDGQEKTRQHRAASKYPRLAVDGGAAETLAGHITEHVLKTQALDLSADAADQSDVRHVAEASLAGVTVLATNDEKLRRWATEAIGVTSVRVMHPSDVILHVDELSRAQAYQPVQLQDTRYRLAPVRSGTEAELLTFLHSAEGEQKARYLELIREIAAGGPLWTRTVLRNPDDKPIAFFATGEVGDELAVPILRITGARLEQTITRQILFQVRDHARREGRSVIRITEPDLAQETQRILREDGFLRLDSQWIALVIRACGSSSAVNAVVARIAREAGLRLPELQPGLSGVIAADLERTMWPAKITDAFLPTYLIPIRSAFSADLFGIPQALTPRPNMIGLSREHVYYRSPTPRPVAPARLLWYVTDARRGGGVAAVIGCSRLDEALTGKPAVLFQRFRHLGVWQLDQVNQAAKGGQAQALKFADTEIFERQITLRHLRQLAADHGQTLALRSPQKITASLFAAIYQEGHPAT
jgi:GNAT superfamily N-acetyltransferase/predicted nucleic acid-binding protein